MAGRSVLNDMSFAGGARIRDLPAAAASDEPVRKAEFDAQKWTFITSWDWSTNTNNVDFTGLSAYRELLIWGDSFTTDTGGTDAPQLRFSTNNGSSFLSTGYVNYGSTSVALILLASPVATASIVGFEAQILDFNHATRRTKVHGISGLAGVGTAPRGINGYRAAGPYDAIRIFASNGANFTAGHIELFGKI